jgi:O-antigen ligase
MKKNMIKNAIRKKLAIFVALGMLCGYECTISILDFLGVATRPYSILIRSLILLASIILLLLNARAKSNNNSTFEFQRYDFLFFCFWALYLARLLFTTASYDDSLYLNIAEYWIWALLVCFIPASSILFIPQSFVSNIKKEFHRYIYIALFVCLISFVLVFFTSFSLIEGRISNSTVLTGRFEIPHLNPISVAYICSLFLLHIFVSHKNNLFLYFTSSKNSAIVITAFFFLLITSSRGPLIAFISSMMLFIYKNKNLYKPHLFVTLPLVTIAFQEFANFFLGNSYRFVKALSSFSTPLSSFSIPLNDASVSDRLTRYKLAIDYIIESPLFGRYIELPNAKGYPHNLLLEALLSTGFLGTFLLGLLFYTVIKKGLISKLDIFSEYIYIAFFFYFIAVQFSGAIYNSLALWTTLSLLILYFRRV